MLGEHRIDFVYVEFNSLFREREALAVRLRPIGELLEPAGFRFIASYPEYMITQGKFFVAQNALFAHVRE